jgi:hypothetical protein
MDRQEMALLAAGVVVALAVVVVLVTGVLVSRARRRLARELVSSREDVATLRGQVEDLSRRLGDAPGAPAAGATPPREFLITTLPGAPSSDLAVPDDEPAPVVSAGRFASVAVGESVVRLLSLGYGVRRALSPENRNRIRFEMRQEVKRARRQRRRDLRDAKRHLRAQQSGGERADLRSDAA